MNVNLKNSNKQKFIKVFTWNILISFFLLFHQFTPWRQLNRTDGLQYCTEDNIAKIKITYILIELILMNHYGYLFETSTRDYKDAQQSTYLYKLIHKNAAIITFIQLASIVIRIIRNNQTSDEWNSARRENIVESATHTRHLWTVENIEFLDSAICYNNSNICYFITPFVIL